MEKQQYETSAQRAARIILSMILLLLKMMCISVEVFIRANIGERYISLLHTIGIGIIYFLLTGFTKDLTPAFDNNVVTGFFLLSAVLVVVHVLRARLRHKNSVEIHSYYGGTPLPVMLFPIPENLFKTYLEPILVTIIGVVLLMLGEEDDKYYSLYGLGIFVIFTGVLMLIKAQIEYYIQRNSYLDMLDKKIESDAISDVMKGKNPKDTKGFAIPGQKTKSEETRQQLIDMYRGIDPTLLKMMEKGQTQEKEPNKVVERTNDKSKDMDVEK